MGEIPLLAEAQPLVVQIVLGVLVIFFFVTIAYSVRTWRFAHIFFLVLCFLGAGTWTVFASMVLKNHIEWRTVVNDLQKTLDETLKRQDIVQAGDVTDITKNDPNIRSVKAEISRVVIDRGRVWRGCSPGNFDGTSVTVGTAPQGGDPAIPPKPNNIEVKTILYVFKELPNADGTLYLPKVYLGEFVATAVTETSVTLTPTIPLDTQQAQQIRLIDSTWALYEVLPIDGHDFFADLPVEELKLLLPIESMPGMSQAEYDALIDSYARTGKPALETDPPEHKWVRVKFLKKKTVQVDADMADPLSIEFFDAQGQALTARIRRGDVVEFDIGDTATLDQETADAWAAAGDVEKQELVYMRPLNDYAKIFHIFYRRREDLADKIAFITRETASIEASTKLAETQVMRGMDEQTKLMADQANYKLEQAAITKLEAELEAQSAELKKRLTETYLLNQQLAAELAALQKQMSDELAKETPKTAALAK